MCAFVGFWDRDYVSQLPCVRYYVVVKGNFKQNDVYLDHLKFCVVWGPGRYDCGECIYLWYMWFRCFV